jgi:hypothetical protein
MNHKHNYTRLSPSFLHLILALLLALNIYKHRLLRTPQLTIKPPAINQLFVCA